MPNIKRRNFLKLALLGSVGLATTSKLKAFDNGIHHPKNNDLHNQSGLVQSAQLFNMSGYGASALKNVRVAFIGMGMRGPDAVYRMSNIQNVDIVAVCDLYIDRAESVKKKLEHYGIKNTKVYGGKVDSWKDMIDKENIDLVYITTPWEWHTPMAVYAMKAGKHSAVEVPAAKNIDECWELVDTFEKTKKHCMMLENCCYDFFELMTLNMARHGYFGDIVHGEGAYIHTLTDLLLDKKGYADMWRLKENATRDGNIYPTHGLGPICQIMNINRGDKMEYLTALASNDFTMKKEVEAIAKQDPFYTPYVNYNYRGNMNTILIKTNKGRSIMIQHDVYSTRPYSRIHVVSGTKGIAQKWPSPEKIANSHKGWLSKEEMTKLENMYTPEIVKKVGNLAKKIGGHGGMDFIMDWRLIDCLRNGLPLDQDVYDAALWSAIGPLSESSIKNRSNSIDIPDFTRGAWQNNKPIKLTLQGGSDTDIVLRK